MNTIIPKQKPIKIFLGVRLRDRGEVEKSECNSPYEFKLMDPADRSSYINSRFYTLRELEIDINDMIPQDITEKEIKDLIIERCEKEVSDAREWVVNRQEVYEDIRSRLLTLNAPLSEDEPEVIPADRDSKFNDDDDVFEDIPF